MGSTQVQHITHGDIDKENSIVYRPSNGAVHILCYDVLELVFSFLEPGKAWKNLEVVHSNFRQVLINDKYGIWRNHFYLIVEKRYEAKLYSPKYDSYETLEKYHNENPMLWKKIVLFHYNSCMTFERKWRFLQTKYYSQREMNWKLFFYSIESTTVKNVYFPNSKALICDMIVRNFRETYPKSFMLSAKLRITAIGSSSSKHEAECLEPPKPFFTPVVDFSLTPRFVSSQTKGNHEIYHAGLNVFWTGKVNDNIGNRGVVEIDTGENEMFFGHYFVHSPSNDLTITNRTNSIAGSLFVGDEVIVLGQLGKEKNSFNIFSIKMTKFGESVHSHFFWSLVMIGFGFLLTFCFHYPFPMFEEKSKYFLYRILLTIPFIPFQVFLAFPFAWLYVVLSEEMMFYFEIHPVVDDLNPISIGIAWLTKETVLSYANKYLSAALADKASRIVKRCFVQISDIHSGFKGKTPLSYLSVVVENVNSIIEKEDIKFALVTGDLSHNGKISEMKMTKLVLDRLQIPYFPLPGNHDIYGPDDSKNKPTGDYKFSQVFSTLLLKSDMVSHYSGNVEVKNPNINEAPSYLQNYVLDYGGIRILAMDYNARVPHMLQRHRASPGVQIMDFDGGTFQWMKDRLSEDIPESIQSIVFALHHPFYNRWYVPKIYKFGWRDDDRKKFEGFMNSLEQTVKRKIFGDISGHLHIWKDDKPFKDFEEHATNAVLRGSMFLLLKVSDGKIIGTERIGKVGR